MGYLNEFPHFEANTLNLDWILEQYSTFNKRLQELHDHFDEAVATMEEDIAQFKSSVNSDLTAMHSEINTFTSSMTTAMVGLRSDFATFTSTVNSNFSTLSTELQAQTSAAIREIEGEIDTLTDNMIEYIGSHMEEWQTDVSSIGFKFIDSTFNSMTSGNLNIDEWLAADGLIAFKYENYHTNDNYTTTGTAFVYDYEPPTPTHTNREFKIYIKPDKYILVSVSPTTGIPTVTIESV